MTDLSVRAADFSSDPSVMLERALRDAIVAAFGEEHRDTDPALRVSQHADYQANVAMGLGKKLGRPPRQIAEAIAAGVTGSALLAKVEIAGPGFLNLTLADGYLTQAVQAQAADPALGLVRATTPERVVIDYSSPNVAKEMHVGHLRSTIIGDCLVRVLEALGHEVMRQNHVGDWGTPFGMLIEHLLDLGEETAARELGLGDLNAFYQQARRKFDADAAFADRSRQRVVLLQAGDEATLALWRTLFDLSARYFAAVYEQLGIRLTRADIAGESFYNPRLDPTIAALEAKGLARESDGAMCVFPAGFAGRDGAPLPLIVRKQDGGYGYATTDLAAIRYRIEQLRGTRLLYVVGAPQNQHLAMVFAAAREAGWLVAPARAEHVAFGSVLGPDKKMLKSREGDAIKLTGLIAEAIERAGAKVSEKNPDLDPEARAVLARAIGIGAIKYADLSSDRIKDYIFDWDRMLAFEGNTAAYVMYACARSHSIFRKVAADEGPAGPEALIVAAPAEHALAAALLRLGSTVALVGTTLEPHHLCGYLFDVARLFATFYDQCPVLKAETPASRRSRLALCGLTARVLARGLDLLGIEVPERM